jgi:hypothetical protein
MTILRDPLDCFESNYVYMGLEAAFGMNINQFAKKKAMRGIRSSSTMHTRINVDETQLG